METNPNQTISIPPSRLISQAYFLHIHLNKHHNDFLVAFIAINAMTSPISVCINLVIIATIVMTTSLQTSSNILLLGVAMSDFCLSLISQPSYCVYLFAEYKRDASLFFKVRNIFIPSCTVFAAVTLLTLTAVMGDRFLAIHLHLRYQEFVKPRRCVILLVFIWGISALFYGGRFVFESLELSIVNQIIFLVFTIALLILNGFFFMNISKAVRRHSAQIHVQELSIDQSSFNMPKFRKSVNTINYIIGAFVLSYVPSILITAVFVSAKEYTQGLRSMLVVGETLLMLNGTMNPFIYCWRITELRNAVQRNVRIQLSKLTGCCWKESGNDNS